MKCRISITCVALAALAAAAELRASDEQLDAVERGLASVRAEVEQTREDVVELGAELRRVRQQIDGKTAAAMAQWKAERDELHREKLAMIRETQRLDRERAEVARLTAFHRSRHPQPAPQRPGEPIFLSDRGHRPRYAQPPAAPNPPPASVYLQPPFFFNNYVTPDPCFGYPGSSVFFHFQWRR